MTPGSIAETRKTWRPLLAASWLAMLPGAFGATNLPAGKVDFNLQIRPLLSDRCFACHGPDDAARKAGLSLHTRDGALRGGKSGVPALNAGRPEDSTLLQRVTTADPDDLMPPPESKLPPLTPEDIDRLRRWIAEGAEYQEHWAFRPVEVRPVPALKTGATALGPWSVEDSNPIDAFVVAGLADHDLHLAPAADKPTLLRRVTLDLTGLPPSVAEIDAFLADRSPEAFVRVVDRLLASSRYGEAMASEWLDLARYADTFGYQADVDVDFSPWRDWVIRAFNENLPWDRFLTWQLAGDLLSEPTRDQKLATAFNRLHRQTNEGGSIEEEFRNEYVSDRVHTFGTAMLGLTLECARCHDHKYDPISQRDYYRLSAYFNSIDESGLYSHFTRATPTPVMLLWEAGQEEQHLQITERIAAAERRLREWSADFPEPPAEGDSPLPPLPDPIVQLSFESVASNRTAHVTGTNVYAELHDSPAAVPGRTGQALHFSGDNSAVIRGAGVFQRTDPFSVGLWLKPTEAQPRAVVFHASRSWTDSGSRGYELVLDHARPVFGLIHFWPGNAVAVRAKEALPLDTWSHVAVTYDGSSRARGLRLYLNGVALETEVLRDHLYKDIVHKAEWGDGEVGGIPLTLAGRFRDSGFKNGSIDEFQVFDVELMPLEIARLAGTASTVENDSPAARAAVHRPRLDAGYREALAELKRWREAENDLITPVREIMAMQEMSTPRPAYVLKRGAYDARGEVVERGTPEAVFTMSPELPRNRLGLARWVTDPNHPLTARVAVNRVWKHHFGRGLVATTWDFGAQGQLPSHPELLDWLARRFVTSGWDRKALHRLIVTSATYRQSSLAPPELQAADPENIRLARGPKHRLAAEQIRDSALAASGLLNPQIGGASVKPYQPAGLWEASGTG
ncbi:MAG: DUF1549 domain-containing protein, partial [Limisphaerales bacterium]